MYNLKDVESKYTVYVNSGETNTARSSFSQYINVPFTPDYVVLKNINLQPTMEIINKLVGNVTGGDAYRPSYSISTNIFNMSPVIAVFGCVVSNVQVIIDDDPDDSMIITYTYCKSPDPTAYKIHSPVVGNFTFNIKNGSGDPVNFFGSVSMQFEFVKLKK